MARIIYRLPVQRDMTTLNDSVAHRLREVRLASKKSEQEVADLLKWSQPRVSQKLTGKTPITLDELAALCFTLDVSPVEAVRDHGLEFCAEMTPTELRILQAIRDLKPNERDALMTILHVSSKPAKPERHAGRSVIKKSHPRN